MKRDKLERKINIPHYSQFMEYEILEFYVSQVVFKLYVTELNYLTFFYRL
jgi:hypothetical protein